VTHSVGKASPYLLFLPEKYQNQFEIGVKQGNPQRVCNTTLARRETSAYIRRAERAGKVQ
jgi:hypothetical protein